MFYFIHFNKLYRFVPGWTECFCEVGVPQQKIKYRFSWCDIYSYVIRSVTKEKILTLEKK